MNRITFEKRLLSVCRRNKVRILYESVSSGLLFASIILIFFFGVHFFARWTVESPWLFTLLGIAAGTLGGLAIGLLTPVDRLESAREIDRFYGLKDRVLTASKISTKSRQTIMENLQIADAVKHTEIVKPQQIVPYRISRELCKVGSIFVPVIILCVVAMIGSSDVNQAAVVPNEIVLSILDQLRNELAVPLEELASENPDDESLQKLNEKFGTLMQQLDAQRSEPQEALLTLNRMEKEITDTMREFNLEAIDASLKEFGEALSLSEATRPAAESMLNGDYDKSAEQLENADFEAMTNRERQTVGNQLDKVAESMERRKQAELAKMTQKLSEDVKKGDCAGCKNTACQFAGVCRKQCARQGACNKLECQLAKLGLCKSQCAGACSSCPSRGQCTSATAQASSEGAGSQSQAGASHAGSESADTPFGEETNELDAHRELQKITGVRGEGDSETQTLKSETPSEASQSEMAFSSEKKLAEYKKQAESILETEPVPFEQHQVIRRYFEAIGGE